jgi:hypothetical protein
MLCYSCARQNVSIPAVAICQRCGAGSCLRHLCEVHAPQVPVGMAGIGSKRLQLVCLRCLEPSDGARLQGVIGGAASGYDDGDHDTSTAVTFLRRRRATEGDQASTKDLLPGDDLPDADVVIHHLEAMLHARQHSARVFSLRQFLRQNAERIQPIWQQLWSARLHRQRVSVPRSLRHPARKPDK